MDALNFFHGIGSVATRYGFEEAALLDSMVAWWRSNRANDRNFRDGRWWTYNSTRALAALFPWWTEKQIRRILTSCVEQGALLEGCYNDQTRDRTKWYTPGPELLALYGEAEVETPICPNGQMQLPKRAEPFAQMGGPLPCNKHDIITPPIVPPEGDRPKKKKRAKKSVPTWEPERFGKFWSAYPRDEERRKAVEEWDKLPREPGLLDEIARGLKRHLECEEWCKDNGRYVPRAWRWLRDERWKEKRKTPATSPAQAPPKPRPYHVELRDGEEVIVYDD